MATVLKTLDALLEKYSPDQDRDESGRWTDTGAAGFPKQPKATVSAKALAQAAKPITEEQAVHMMNYISPEHTLINETLRGNNDSDAARDIAKTFASAAHPLPEGTILYRGLGGDAITDKLVREDMKPGSVVTMRGLTSTSFKPFEGDMWAGKKGVILEIKAKRGVVFGKHLDKYFPQSESPFGEDDPFSFDTGENEVVLPHMSKFKIIANVKKVKFGKTWHPVIQMEQL